MTSSPLSPEARASLLEKLRLAEELERRKRENRLASYRPYPKQKAFHAAGAEFRERLFMAGNQLGKTFSGGCEAAIHSTGLYPDWWEGRRFKDANKGWVAGVTGESTRDNPQRILLGEPGQFGTGTIPKRCIEKIVMARGVPNLVDSVFVRHVTGSTSMIAFKAYEKGREKWQGETLHWLWFDEEPPLDIYTEGLTRTNVTGGITFVTFTPLLGMSDTVLRFIGDGEAKSPGTHVTNMTIDDAEHYTPEQRAAIVASYPPHEREARAKGVPILGSGRVFPISEEAITMDPIRIPDEWAQIGGLDFGWDHPTAAVRLCWDRDADCVYVTHIHRLREATPVIHAATLKPWGDWLPWAWPHDGLQHDKGSGDQLAKLYRDQGMKMLPDRATFPDGSNGLEAGVIEMLERMQTGRLKVFSTLTEWFEEFRMYHRKNGLIVKERDDLLSATRYGIMMLRHAKAKPKKVVRPVGQGPTGPHGWMGV
jgi:phage terminase large subunit-like protein